METTATAVPTTHTPDAGITEDSPRGTLRLVQHEVSEFAEKSKAQLMEAQTRATETVDGATRAIGQRLVVTGETIVKSGKLTGFQLRRMGRYLDRTAPGQMLTDLGRWAQENPRIVAAAVAGTGLATFGLLRKVRS